ncbi:DUF4169 family protein [Alkalilacustris brevis]|uniref:DUF4169 family protein n=1 Tax=Alkalilacustris brevis TaxID=2026338 RepID=UPI000E0DDF25|nr:DUF4169 family protein [Alkalilacustris brevis]
MGKPVNLRQARKQRARLDRRAQADANAARHGQSRASRETSAQEAAKLARHLDDHKLDDDS